MWWVCDYFCFSASGIMRSWLKRAGIENSYYYAGLLIDDYASYLSHTAVVQVLYLSSQKMRSTRFQHKSCSPIRLVTLQISNISKVQEYTVKRDVQMQWPPNSAASVAILRDDCPNLFLFIPITTGLKLPQVYFKEQYWQSVPAGARPRLKLRKTAFAILEG